MDENKIREVLERTEILKHPRQLLETFGSSMVTYYILSRSVYDELARSGKVDTVLRRGELTWEQPRLITPQHMLRMEGFSEEGTEALKYLARENPNLAALLYTIRYEKKHEQMEVLSETLEGVKEKIEREIDRKKDPLSVIIKGVPGFWDVSLMKFVHEMVLKSAYYSQFPTFRKRGFIRTDSSGYPEVVRDEQGIPKAAREKIEKLFKQVKSGEIEASRLKEELDYWGVYEIYEDRFLDLFRK